jgi:UDP-N-acetylmuramoyl-L-alanyl-D-glutamate--2,6-diaminopimelate ligase
LGGGSHQHGGPTNAPALGDLVESIATIERGDPALRILSVTDDSRKVVPGALFVAKRGARLDGGAFIQDALARGASAILVEHGAPSPSADHAVSIVRAPCASAALARLAERIHGDPSARLRVFGVTGTNGKTTVSTLLRSIIEAHGVRCGLVSTCAIDAGAGESLDKATQTTPGAVELSERLASMRERGCGAAVIETSSHALDQLRVAAIQYRVAVFTNLTGDHLDYHGTMERYADAKAKLFAMLPADGFAIINADDPWAARMVSECAAVLVACTATDESTEAIAARLGRPVKHLARVRMLGASPRGVAIELLAPFGDVSLDLPLHGGHNAMNALQAACAAWAGGVDAKTIIESLSNAAAPPGRLEPVTRAPGVEELFKVFVDYAHTDDALERALLAIRPQVGESGTLRVVFGCGGDRDRTKRPRMGAVASKFADEVIITSDNPRTENPDSIVAQVLTGVLDSARATPIVDRRQAIRFAIKQAGPGDVVLIAGKGHEDYQIVPDGHGGAVTRHFDDREEAREALLVRFGGSYSIETKAPVATPHGWGGEGL